MAHERCEDCQRTEQKALWWERSSVRRKWVARTQCIRWKKRNLCQRGQGTKGILGRIGFSDLEDKPEKPPKNADNKTDS